MFSWLSQEPSTRRVCTAGRTTRRPRKAPPPTTTATWATRWRRETSPARGGRDAPSACPRAPTFSERCVPTTANEFDATVFIFLSLSACARQNELWTVIRLRFGSSLRRRGRDACSSAQKVGGGREKIYTKFHTRKRNKNSTCFWLLAGSCVVCAVAPLARTRSSLVDRQSIWRGYSQQHCSPLQ